MSGRSITVVSGLPRSGTSLMMSVLKAGGLEAMTDRIRTADEDNPKGYYEFEAVKKLPANVSWLEEAEGRVVKVISKLLIHLPANHTYQVVFMRRDMREILASQEAMLRRRGYPADPAASAAMSELFRRHLQEVQEWLARQTNMNVHYVSYNELIAEPERLIADVSEFLGLPFDEAKVARVVDQSLHRQRAS